MIELSTETSILINDTKKFAVSKLHNIVSAYHLGIVILRDNVILNILNPWSIDVNGIKTMLLSELDKNNYKSKDNTFNISTELNNILVSSYNEAKSFESNIVTNVFIFLSLLKNETNVKNIFNEYGVFYDEIKNIYTGDNDGSTVFGSPSSNKKNIETKSKTPVLDSFGRDLSKLADEGKIDPIIGRDKEILRVSQILSRRTKRNPLLIGEPGCVVGSTMIKVKKISDLNTHNIIKK